MRSLFTLLLIVFAGKLSATSQPALLQLAETYRGDIHITDYFVSEKLDGVRARWTGTQLITRNGNPIHAPMWFTRNWPAVAMDGELWNKRGNFEEIASIVLSHAPDERWQSITMMVFDLPTKSVAFKDRVANMTTLIAETDNPHLKMVKQFTLDSLKALENELDSITSQGGEGLMLHYKNAHYQNGRNPGLLKAKRYQDDEAKVLAHLPGKGRFKGLMGSLLVESREGHRFKIGTGFSYAQRQSPPPVGSWITYKFFGLTKRGIPRFASFLHRRPNKDTPP